jgi:protease I
MIILSGLIILFLATGFAGAATVPDRLGSHDVRVLVIIAPQDYNEEELNGTLSALKGAGIGYTIASSRLQAAGMSGGTTGLNRTIEDMKNTDISGYAGIILIGGSGSIRYLYDDTDLQDLVRSFYDQGKLVGAICASPVILSRAGILKGKKVTMFGDPVLQEELRSNGARVSDAAVVIDGRIITGNGPYAAAEFGTTVADALKNG